jgi:hypothetical protein
MSNDQWQFWRDQLAGKNPETTPGHPHTGIYRQKTSKKGQNGERIPVDRSVYIWWQDGKCFCLVSDGFCPKVPDEIDELFARVCRNAVTKAQYDEFKATGKWWDHVDMPTVAESKNGMPVEESAPPMGHNNPPETLPAYKQIEAKVNETLDEFRKWFKGIGGKILNQEHADKLGNYAEAFQRFQKQAEKTFDAEKLPYDTALKDIRANWKPVIELADEKKKAAKKLALDWAVAEKKRREEEHAKAQAEYDAKVAAARAKEEAAAAEAGQEPVEAPPLDLPPPPADVGNVAMGTAGRKVALKERTVYEVADKKAFLRWILDNLSPFPDELDEPLAKIGRRLGPQMENLPAGLTKRTEQTIA